MHRTRVMVGVLGLALAAVAVQADVPKSVKLFSQEYDITVESLAGTYKNGLKVTQPDDFADRVNNRRTNLDLVLGETADKDRMFVGAAPAVSDTTCDQLYLMTGSNADGLFGPKHSSLTQFFGGNVAASAGGRVSDVTWLSDENTGVKKDFNIMITTFFGDDHYRFYDLDSLQGDFHAAEVGYDVSHVIQGIGSFTEGDLAGEVAADHADPNGPARGQYTHTRGGPNGTIVAMAMPPSGLDGTLVSLLNPKTGKYHNVLTNLNDATGGALTVDGGENAHSLCHVGGNEFWFLYTSPDPGGNGNDETRHELVRVELTFPSDLNAGANSIKVKLLGQENLLENGLYGAEPEAGIFGMAIGRDAGNGKKIVYLTDWNGNIYTLRPR